MRYAETLEQLLGKTPLVDVSVLFSNKARVLGKVEGMNPSGSVKFRTAVAMVNDAERRELLGEGVEIVEPTSGNTGIALACVGAFKGYKVHLVMPEYASRERVKLMELFGADVILTDANKGMKGAIEVARGMVEESRGRFFMPDQFSNPANPYVHEKTTGVEIFTDTDGLVDAVVAGVGTGGTITGIARYLKAVKRDVCIVAVEPAASPAMGCFLSGKSVEFRSHIIEGIGAGFLPPVLDISLIDTVEAVGDDEAVEFSRMAAEVCGLGLGISSGAALAAVSHLLLEDRFTGSVVVVVLPDFAEKYLSTRLFAL